MAVKGGLRISKMVKVDYYHRQPGGCERWLQLSKMVKVDYYHRQPGGCERWSTTTTRSRSDGKCRLLPSTALEL